jgi:hypothetical protein
MKQRLALRSFAELDTQLLWTIPSTAQRSLRLYESTTTEPVLLAQETNMGSHLFNETGHASQDDRNTEAIRYIEELAPYAEAMQPHEKRFVEDMLKQKEQNNLHVSGKQIFWLRDLYEKFCC